MPLIFDKPKELITEREWRWIINQLILKHPYLKQSEDMQYIKRLDEYVSPSLKGRTSYGEGIDRVEWEKIKGGLRSMLPDHLRGIIPDLVKLGDEALHGVKGGSLAGY